MQLPEEMKIWSEAFLNKIHLLEYRVSQYLPKEDVDKVRDACFFGAWAHKGQNRSSGEPYIFHPIEVATILTEVRLDTVSIISAVLHDVIEDTEVTFQDIETKFGTEIAKIVDGVSKLTQIRFSSKKEAKAENFRKMVLAMTKDLRVIMVKLADRLHNMRTLGALAPYKKRRIARDTLDIYAPIAARLGMFALQTELENLCFANIYPLRYRVLNEAINKKRIIQGPVVAEIKENIRTTIESLGFNARVSIREKHAWSIYKKLNLKGKISQIHDIFSIRVIVQTVDECYRSLGVVHNLNKPIIGRFKDFIAIPKVNGYQGLHTVVFGANMLPVEVQIRTRDMHLIAEIGAAAHWRYKEIHDEQSHNQAKTKLWLDYVTELQNSMSSSEEFMESMKADLFPSEIYVFTPNGKIIELPKGATPIDFAYSIHSDIGNTCISAKIDSNLAPLNQILLTGQTIEIQTSPSAKPNPAWLEFARTAKARSAIRSYLNKLSFSDAISTGKELLKNALKIRNIDPNQIDQSFLLKLVRELQFSSIDEMYAEIGYGRRPSGFIINRLSAHGLQFSYHGYYSVDEQEISAPPELTLAIKGADGLHISLAQCCYPLPGDDIIGYVNSREGVTVHRANCGHIEEYKNHPDRWKSLSWKKNTKETFPVQLFFVIKNRQGTIAEITSEMTRLDINITNLQSKAINKDYSFLWLIANVIDRKHLADILRHLRQLQSVVRVSRKEYENIKY